MTGIQQQQNKIKPMEQNKCWIEIKEPAKKKEGSCTISDGICRLTMFTKNCDGTYTETFLKVFADSDGYDVDNPEDLDTDEWIITEFRDIYLKFC
jgi:hypothetical protein